jgi:hypothetical protein
MKPACYLLDTANGKTILYLEDVSTIECLTYLPERDAVRIVEFGATMPDGRWMDPALLFGTAVVSELMDKLQENSEMSLVSFAADVGSVHLSTHDDGEAELRFRSQQEALAFLGNALASPLSAEVIPRLLESPGRYVAKLEGSWTSFETFDAYLAHQFAADQKSRRM